ncbi:MAG: ABC transporter ATP-binding protein [Woeseiaceae bacterium]
MNAIEVSALKFGYDGSLTVDIDKFTLEKGKSVSVIGPSGCGKTSFLHLVAGLLTPQSGDITILGQSLATLNGAQLDRFRGSTLGLVLQKFHLIRALTVRENLLLAGRLSRKPPTSAGMIDLLRKLDILDVTDHKPSMLSQGQAQRAAIARALIHRPPIVLADEPTSALDDRNAAEAIELLRSLVAETDAALVVVTHDQRIRGVLDADFDFGSTT